MSDAVDGFLAESLDDVRSHVRRKYTAWHSLLMRVNRLAVTNQHAIKIQIDSNLERYSAVLFARTLATTQASVLLLETGLVPQARILLRSALETFFALVAISKDVSVVDKLIEGHAAEQIRAVRNVQLWKDDTLRMIVKSGMASVDLDLILNDSATSLSVFELAQKAGLEDWYRTVYMVFSWSVHGAAIDLNRHVVLDNDGNAIEFRNEPEVDNQENSWMCAIEVILKSIAALATIFPVVDQSPIEQLYAETHSLAAKAAG